MSKGSKQRPTNQATFDKNYDSIFNSKSDKNCQSTIDVMRPSNIHPVDLHRFATCTTPGAMLMVNSKSDSPRVSDDLLTDRDHYIIQVKRQALDDLIEEHSTGIQA